MSMPGGSVGTAFITILPNTDKFVATLVAQMRGVSAAASSAGNDAVKASANFEVLGAAIGDAGDSAEGAAVKQTALGHSVSEAGQAAAASTTTWTIQGAAVAAAGSQALSASASYVALGAGAAVAGDQVGDLNRQLAESSLLRGAGGLLGGPPSKGIATDLGSVFKFAATAAQGFLGVITLIAPTINIIIAALIGVVSLLGTAVIAATALAVALGATAAAMAFAAFKWRDLITQGNQGAETWRGALLAIEAEAFNMSKALVESFSDGSKAGTDMWTSIGEAGVRFLRMMQPVIDWIVTHVTNFFDALNGESGATSPFLDFMRTWLEEWRVLGNIINQGIEGGGGLLGFFEKYEKPAKAFVEGIAQVINAIRQMSALGLGLNMDQLAEFIRNVFTAVSQVVMVFPRFSNALVSVGLEVTRFILAIMPIVSESIKIGAAILQYIVAPLVNGLLKALQALLEMPVIGWLVEIAGGFALVAVALAKLSFGSKSFVDILGYMIKAFGFLAATVGQALAPALAKAGIELGTLGLTIAGGLVVAAAMIAIFIVLRGAMEEVADRAKDITNTVNQMWVAIGKGEPVVASLAAIQNEAADSYNKLSYAGKAWFAVTHLGDIALRGMDATMITVQETLDGTLKLLDEAASKAQADIFSGMFSQETLANLKTMQELATQGLTQPMVTVTGAAGREFVVPEQGTAAAAQYEIQQQAASDLDATLVKLDAAYAAHAINAGQYATMLEQLGVTANSAGREVDLAALKIEGAANTIAEALIQVQKSTDLSTDAFANFAYASGQSLTQLNADAAEALLDPAGGLLGTGAKVKEFFQQQQAAIEQWKETTADAFNTVKSAFMDLADTGPVSAQKIIDTLTGGLGSLRKYSALWKDLASKGYTKTVLADLVAMGPAGVNVAKGLAEATKGQVKQINTLYDKGLSVSSGLAAEMASAIGLAMDQVVNAIIVMTHEITGTSIPEIKRKLDELMHPPKGVAKLDVDDRLAREKVQRLKEDLSKPQELMVDGRPASQKLDEIALQYREHTFYPVAKADADTDPASNKLTGLSHQYGMTFAKVPKVDADTSPALAALNALDRKLLSMKNYQIHVSMTGVDTGSFPPPKDGQAAGGIIKGATGFIARSPTYLVGEGHSPTRLGRGAEAVIPLNERGRKILREALADGGTGPQVISGELTLTANSRAYIRGVIHEEVRGVLVDGMLGREVSRRAG